MPSTSLRFREGDLRERPREYAAIFLDVETSARRPDKRPPELRNLSSGLISGFFENGAATAAAGLACPGGLACGSRRSPRPPAEASRVPEDSRVVCARWNRGSAEGQRPPRRGGEGSAAHSRGRCTKWVTVVRAGAELWGAMTEPGSLEGLWKSGRSGSLSALEQMRAVAFRDVYKEMGQAPQAGGQDAVNGSNAAKLAKIGGGHPSKQAVAKLFARIDEDAGWYPGKRYQEQFGPAPALNGAKRRCIAASAMAAKKDGNELEIGRPTHSGHQAGTPRRGIARRQRPVWGAEKLVLPKNRSCIGEEGLRPLSGGDACQLEVYHGYQQDVVQHGPAPQVSDAKTSSLFGHW